MLDFFAQHTVVEGDYALKNIAVEEELGKGNSHVYTVMVKNEMMAMKQIKIKTEQEYESFLKEITLIKDLSKENVWIVKYLGYLVTKLERDQYDRGKYAFIFMECAEVNFEDYLQHRKVKRDQLATHELHQCLDQLLSAFTSLQEKNIAHCDIKPENILLMNSTEFRFKLCDVGSCKIVSNNLQEATILGTVPFLAPELVKIKNKKIATSNPFKSDVFSLGLVMLYTITTKKFKSHDRLSIEESTYQEVIEEWVKEAIEITDNDPILTEMLKLSLEFDESKRPTFKKLINSFLISQKKLNSNLQTYYDKIVKEKEEKYIKPAYFLSTPASNELNLFSRKNEKERNLCSTTISGNAFRIAKTRNHSPSPASKKSSQSPQKSALSVESRKLIVVNEENKEGDFQGDFDRIFVLSVSSVNFKQAEAVTILPSCPFDVFYALSQVKCKKLFIQCHQTEKLGLATDAPLLNFTKIKANLIRCKLIGGFSGLFRIFTHDKLESLELLLTESEATLKDLMTLLDKIQEKCPLFNALSLTWEYNQFGEEDHSQLLERISRLSLKRLVLVMNENYIHHEKPIRWPLPRLCQTLYLDYSLNFLNSVVSNLSISLKSSVCLRELYLNLENNNLAKGEVHMLMGIISKLKTLDKIVLNFAFNRLEELKYLEAVFLEEALNMSTIEIKLHKTEVPTSKVVDFIFAIKELFEFKLKILRVTCDRTMPLAIFAQLIEKDCIKDTPNLKCNILPYDSNYFMVYIKKRDKGHLRNKFHGKKSQAITKRRMVEIGTPALKESRPIDLPKLNLTTSTSGDNSPTFHSNMIKKCSAPDKSSPQEKAEKAGETIEQKAGDTIEQKSTVCTQLYTTSLSFNNYLCLDCSQNTQMGKYIYYCRHCINGCTHKDHSLVKVNERTICSCSYGGTCQSNTSIKVCAEVWGVEMKKEHKCMKCQLRYCVACVKGCRETHPEYLLPAFNICRFKCRSKFPLQ